jgi:hypothetical protein
MEIVDTHFLKKGKMGVPESLFSRNLREFYSKMFGIGAFSPNDILGKENMNGYQGGDEHFMPLNMMPVEQQGRSSE